MIIQHNITHNRFFHIYVEPSNADIYDVFRSKDNEGEIITRRWCVPTTMDTDRVTLVAIRKYEEDGVQYVRKWSFLIVEEKGEKGFYQDEYCMISILGGKVLKPKANKAIKTQTIIKKIVKSGYESAADWYEIWQDCCKDDPDYSKDNNGYPIQDEFGDDVFSRFQVYMEENEDLKEHEWMCLIGFEEFNRYFCQGVQKFMDKHFPSQVEVSTTKTEPKPVANFIFGKIGTKEQVGVITDIKNKFYSQLGEWMKFLREKNEMSPDALADNMCISTKRLSDIECGVTEITFFEISAFCLSLEIPISEFVKFVDDMKF